LSNLLKQALAGVSKTGSPREYHRQGLGGCTLNISLPLRWGEGNHERGLKPSEPILTPIREVRDRGGNLPGKGYNITPKGGAL